MFTNKSMFTTVILGLFGVLAISGIIFLSATHNTIPEILTFIATGALSAIAGISVPISGSVSNDVRSDQKSS